MTTKLCLCYLRNASHKELAIFLPNDLPVVIGRMPELKITDKTCSRNQLELRANYDKRYVLVKRLGANPSQIDGIAIQSEVASKLKPGQKLFLVNMKYPHYVTFDSDDADEAEEKLPAENSTKTSVGISVSNNQRKRPGAVYKTNAKPAKIQASCNNIKNSLTSEYDFNTPQKDDNKYFKPSIKPNTSSKHWSQGLKASMSDPKLVVFQDDIVVVIKDKYPKAKCHWLVLPFENISHPYQLRSGHLELVQHMLKIGKKIAHDELSNDSSLNFKFGYHAVASMSQLHMHVISQDFSSSCLKTKKHWNSFTTEYFVDAEEIINDLKENDKVKDRKSYTKCLNQPLRCHRCNALQKNMPTLKQHIINCKKSS